LGLDTGTHLVVIFLVLAIAVSMIYANNFATGSSYFEQKSYSGDCGARPSGTVCIAYSDGYIWLVSDSIQGWEEIQQDGRNVQVAVGFNARYYHIPNMNLVGIGPPVPGGGPAAEPAPGYIQRESYSGDCGLSPTGTSCITYSDGYIWLVSDLSGITGGWEDVQEDGRNVQITFGFNTSYHHILNTNLVKATDTITQALLYIEQKSYSKDCDARPSGTACIAYSDGYILLVTDSIQGWEDVQEDGKNVQVAVGNNARYYHILNPNLVGVGPPESVRDPEPRYFEQEPYSKDCGERRSGTVCLAYSDGYIWLISDSVLSWEEVRGDSKNIEVAVGNNARYYHIPNPNLVKTDPTITQAAPEPEPVAEPAPEPAPELAALTITQILSPTNTFPESIAGTGADVGTTVFIDIETATGTPVAFGETVVTHSGGAWTVTSLSFVSPFSVTNTPDDDYVIITVAIDAAFNQSLEGTDVTFTLDQTEPIAEPVPEPIAEPVPEPIAEPVPEIVCGAGTILKDGFCVPERETMTTEMQQQSRGGGCLIATATFGSELAPQVQQLREIRDNSLLQTESGRSFMKSFNQFYYSFSPEIADLERENPVFKEVVKLAITPLLSSLSLLNYVDMDSEAEVLGYGISLILLNVGMYFVLPAVIIHRIKN